jgi:preprotein translocase subunit SecA
VIEKIRREWQQRHSAVLSSGGLHIIGTERHESRRVDNQLRGRAGRQGDPGSSRFYLSLQDNLMRIFASDRVSGLMQKLGMGEGEAIEHPWVTKAIENAQRKVEGRNFDIRKQLLEYDNVANDQRKEVYKLRNEYMEANSVAETIKGACEDVLSNLVDQYIPPHSLEEMWNVPGLKEALEKTLALSLPITEWLKEDDATGEQEVREKIWQAFEKIYQEKEQSAGADVMRRFEKAVLLQVLDKHWKDHLAAMDYLRQGIHLRGYAQKNPKQEFKREAFAMFEEMLGAIKQEVVDIISKVQVRTQTDVDAVEEQRRQTKPMHFKHAAADSLREEESAEGVRAEDVPQHPFVRQQPKIGRNELCPCGSGKKYKHCHGKI